MRESLFMQMQSPVKAQAASHLILALAIQKAVAITGVCIPRFGWRLQPNIALNPDARTSGLDLRWPARGRRLALR